MWYMCSDTSEWVLITTCASHRRNSDVKEVVFGEFLTPFLTKDFAYGKYQNLPIPEVTF